MVPDDDQEEEASEPAARVKEAMGGGGHSELTETESAARKRVRSSRMSPAERFNLFHCLEDRMAAQAEKECVPFALEPPWLLTYTSARRVRAQSDQPGQAGGL